MSHSKSMGGRVCVVTGANSGIGKETAIALARFGATVIMVCRNKGKGERAVAETRAKTGNDQVSLAIADLSSFQSVRSFAGQLQSTMPQLHVLVNNAGLFNIRRHETEDGCEMTFQVNYLSHFLLTNLLLDLLTASAPSRVVNVSSVAHRGGKIDFEDLQAERGYSGFSAYSQSKLAQILFTHELAKRTGGTGLTVNALHPGAVATNIWSRPAGRLGFIMKLPGLFMRRARDGAATSVYLASSSEVERVTGEYFEKKKQKKSSEASYDPAVAEKLWTVSRALVHL